jgi:homocysteine S-methyltransferase
MDAIQILDGGLGTSLEDRYGVKFDDSTPLWSSQLVTSHKDTLLACQRDFAEAGADVLLTATYQVSIEGFAKTKTAEHPNGVPKSAIGQYLKAAVDIAGRAKVRDTTKLALGLGPYGACMVPSQEYSGKYDAAHDSERALYDWHLERLRLFTAVDGLMDRVHFIAFETIPRLDEIRAVRQAMASAGIRKDFWISSVFPGAPNTLPDGSTVEQVIEAMLGPLDCAATPWGVGINCTKIAKLPDLVRNYETAVSKMTSSGTLPSSPALVLYPDGTKGEIYNTTTKTWEQGLAAEGPQKQGVSLYTVCPT